VSHRGGFFKQGLSLVIPSNHPEEDLRLLLLAVLKGTLVPDEILIVQSSTDCLMKNRNTIYTLALDSELNHLVTALKVNLKILNVARALPGEARNIGVENAHGEIVAFLDVKTVPNETWLERSIQLLQKPDFNGVWGSRQYESNTILGRLIRDAIYGSAPVRSVAGSVFRKEVFTVTGKMISWVPAGEDGDWIRRVEAHKLQFVFPGEANHYYHGLDRKPLSFFVKKWWRYYHYSRLLSVNDRDRWIAQGLLYFLLIFIAFNWNYKISDALFGSPLVIPHITTIVAITGPVLYLFVRGIYLPIKRQTPVDKVFPVRFAMILVIALTLDLVKVLALLTPTTKSHTR